MRKALGPHTSGEPPDILEDFGGECVYLHCCLAEVPAPTCSPPPCSRARSRVGSKLKRVHKIERGVVVFLEDSGGDFLFGGANRDEGVAETERQAVVTFEDVGKARKKRKLKPIEAIIVVPHIAPTRSASRSANMVSLYSPLIQQKADCGAEIKPHSIIVSFNAIKAKS